MTFSPDQIGDKGQRFEIGAVTNDGDEIRIGWSDDPDAYAWAVAAHPGLRRRLVIDREAVEAKKEDS